MVDARFLRRNSYLYQISVMEVYEVDGVEGSQFHRVSPVPTAPPGGLVADPATASSATLSEVRDGEDDHQSPVDGEAVVCPASFGSRQRATVQRRQHRLLPLHTRRT